MVSGIVPVKLLPLTSLQEMGRGSKTWIKCIKQKKNNAKEEIMNAKRAKKWHLQVPQAGQLAHIWGQSSS